MDHGARLTIEAPSSNVAIGHCIFSISLMSTLTHGGMDFG
jgi:hypothetical protein